MMIRGLFAGVSFPHWTPMERWCRITASWIGAAGLLACSASADSTANDSGTQQQLHLLQQQNDALQQQMLRQQEMIENLSRKVAQLESSGGSDKDAPEPAHSQGGFSTGKLHLSGEGQVGFFNAGSHGQFPNSEFRIDEAKLFVEAQVWNDVYFFSEINLFLREEDEYELRPGELYLDAENLSQLWGQDRQLNLRAGRIDIPFGEEYQTHDAIDNPLVSHSIMNLWGVDEGVELYGALDRFQYVLAVQNGGHSGLRDFNRDKAVIARVGVDPVKWLHLSVSGMRTGALDVKQDQLSELWLGSGFVRPLGSAKTTVFRAGLLEGDVQLKLPRTTVKLAGGMLQYSDDDPTADNGREVYYYYAEGVQKLYGGFYAAVRWSQVFADKGFPIAGNGNVGTYAFSPVLTKDLWLLSLGVGYRWSEQLVFKVEYSLEQGHTINGPDRTAEDLLAVTAAFAF